MKFIHYICLIHLLGFLGCTSTAERQRMLRFMTEVDSLNRNYISLAGDSVMPAVTEWMDRHGTHNERMKAHYLLASVYRDRGQAPEALDEFQKAVNCADTTAADCDYRLLSRVHGQMAELFGNQYLPVEALQENRLCRTYAKIANDTLLWLVASEHLSRLYNIAGHKDSAAMAAKQAFALFQQYHYTEAATNSIEPLLFYLIENNEYSEIKTYMDFFEERSDLYDSRSLKALHPTYYYIKGKYYYYTGHIDSALFFFRQLLPFSDNSRYAEMAYNGLYMTYQTLNKNDSAVKYAGLCYDQSNKSFLAASTQELRRMQAQYNYSLHQAQAHQKEKEASQIQRRLIVVSSISCFAILLLVFFISHLVVGKRNQIARLTREYEYRIEHLQKVEHELEKNSFEDLRKEKEKELERNKQQLLEMLGLNNTKTNSSVNLYDNEVYSLFQKAASRPTFKLEECHWKMLHELFDEKIPTFKESISHGKAMTERDLRLCMLLRLHFGVSEICVIMQTYSQYVSIRRRQLLRKYFKIEGKPEEFDKIISLIA